MGWTAWFAGSVDLCGVVASVLPLVIFGVTADWTGAFDCFGGLTLTTDLLTSYLKTGMLLFVVGLSQETIWVIYDSVLGQLMDLCLVGASLFFYWSHKSHHGQNVALAQLSLGLLALFLSGIAVAIFGMKFNWIMSDTFVKWYTGFTVIVHLLQLLVPVIVRLIHQNMDNDETLVFIFKMISTVFCLITSSYESWSIGTHLNVADRNRMVCLLIVYIFSAVSSLLQCGVRIVGPERFAKWAKQLWAKTCCG